MVQLFLLDLTPLQSGRWRDLLPLLPPERQQKVLTFRFDPDRARAAGAGWLLQYALEQAGIPSHLQVFSKTELGKPFLAHFPKVHFSLSHSGHWSVCAVGDHPLGVDVELPRCTPAIARRFFRPEEVECLWELPEPMITDQLNRLWTAKEAFVKALGGGLTIALNSFTVHLHAQGAELEQQISPLPYRLHEYRPDLSRICLCTTADRPELIRVTP